MENSHESKTQTPTVSLDLADHTCSLFDAWHVIFAAGLMAISTSTLDENGEATLFVVGTTVVVSGVVVVVLVTAFSGLAKGRSWGRWLTVGLFFLQIMQSILRVVSPIVGDESGAFRTGRVMGAIAIVALLGFLTFRLAAGDPANDFFNPPEEFHEIAEPPPPPTFAE